MLGFFSLAVSTLATKPQISEISNFAISPSNRKQAVNPGARGFEVPFGHSLNLDFTAFDKDFSYTLELLPIYAAHLADTGMHLKSYAVEINDGFGAVQLKDEHSLAAVIVTDDIMYHIGMRGDLLEYDSFNTTDSTQIHEMWISKEPANAIIDFGRHNRKLLQLEEWDNCGKSMSLTVGMAVDASFIKQVGIDNVPDEIAYIAAAANQIYRRQMNINLLVGDTYYAEKAGQPQWNQNPNDCSREPSETLDYLRSWRASTANDAGVWHLLTDCYPPPGVVGVAYVGALCEREGGYGTGLSTWMGLKTWITVAHELGHNFNADHSFEDGQGSTGGIMDYGDGLYKGVYQFHPYRRSQVCSHIKESQGFGLDWCWTDYTEDGGDPPDKPPTTPCSCACDSDGEVDGITTVERGCGFHVADFKAFCYVSSDCTSVDINPSSIYEGLNWRLCDSSTAREDTCEDPEDPATEPPADTTEHPVGTPEDDCPCVCDADGIVDGIDTGMPGCDTHGTNIASAFCYVSSACEGVRHSELWNLNWMYCDPLTAKVGDCDSTESPTASPGDSTTESPGDATTESPDPPIEPPHPTPSPPPTFPTPPGDDGCTDSDSILSKNCQAWKERGFCWDEYAPFMWKFCSKTCDCIFSKTEPSDVFTSRSGVPEYECSHAGCLTCNIDHQCISCYSPLRLSDHGCVSPDVVFEMTETELRKINDNLDEVIVATPKGSDAAFAVRLDGYRSLMLPSESIEEIGSDFEVRMSIYAEPQLQRESLILGGELSGVGEWALYLKCQEEDSWCNLALNINGNLIVHALKKIETMPPTLLPSTDWHSVALRLSKSKMSLEVDSVKAPGLPFNDFMFNADGKVLLQRPLSAARMKSWSLGTAAVEDYILNPAGSFKGLIKDVRVYKHAGGKESTP